MIERFVSPNNPVLKKSAESVFRSEFGTPEIESIIDGMLKIAHGEQEQKDKPVLVGLAAPQLGISKRIILVDIGADGRGKTSDLRIYLNPEIISKSEDESEYYEGCYSTGNVCGIVSRPNSIKIKARTREGKMVEEQYSGYVARIFQHEIDHLNGVDFISHISDDDKLHWVEKEEFPEYRKNWRKWSKKCSREKWEQMST